ncbi:hypothetical protein C6P40_003472 [Pichia californica]|uniref:Zn(2)-C6 fungal-type domain-containing protein n=1 Tax=Pichia californica TaxID=460514 RepID=A0A9P6WIK2_9ASCO|nr:hypothetical protein C6P42_000774 [[Candida] californica]KAG0686728.1 hypothetical protein C6P40_003472 [[Candida] californica]
MISSSTVHSPSTTSTYNLRDSTNQRKNYTMSNSSSSDSEDSSSNQSSKIKRSKSIKSNSKKPKKETPPEKRRVRTGCLTCRSKHKKCDETKPVCKFCQSKNLQCIWPHEGMSRPAQLNDTLKQLLSLKKMDSNTPIINSNPNLNLDSNSVLTSSNASTTFSDLTLLPNTMDFSNSSLNEISSQSPNYLQLPSNFPSILSIIPALQTGNFTSTINSFIFFNDKSVTSTNSLFTQSLTNLLSNYFLTDPTYILHLSNPNHILSLSRESKSLTYSILAISSRLLEQFDTSYSGENTLDFYLLSVRELSKSLRNEVQGIVKDSTVSSKECIWWTVILLAWFEVFSVNPINCWDRIEGIINFFDTLGIFEDTKSYHTFIGLIMIPWCCKMKQLQDKTDDTLTPTSVSIIMDSSIEIALQKICSSSKQDIINLAFQSFFVKGDIKQWVDLWNALLDWRLRSTGNEEFKQNDGAIILAVDKDLFNHILYHVACYYLLNNKPDNISLIFQSPNDYTTIVAFAMCQDRHDCDELIQWHRARLIKILESNMITKNKKSIYSSCACWFAGFVLNDDKQNKVEVKNLLQKIAKWCNLDIFKWLIQTYD